MYVTQCYISLMSKHHITLIIIAIFRIKLWLWEHKIDLIEKLYIVGLTKIFKISLFEMGSHKEISMQDLQWFLTCITIHLPQNLHHELAYDNFSSLPLL